MDTPAENFIDSARARVECITRWKMIAVNLFREDRAYICTRADIGMGIKATITRITRSE